MIRKLMEKTGMRNLFMLLFKILDTIWPKDLRLAVFSGFEGVRFTDNSRFLYESFLREYSKEMKIM